MRTCKHVEDICELRKRRRSRQRGEVHCPTESQCTLHSPNPSKKSNKGRRYFCVYNISLQCPDESVEIRHANNLTWPKSNHQNYVAFYANRSEETLDDQVFGDDNNHFPIRLETSSFMAILYTNNKDFKGYFEFIAQCTTEKKD